MRTLLLLRHAKSSWKHPALADHDRPLNKRGREAAPRLGALLMARDLVPDLLLCSTALRAQATAGLVAAACGYTGEIRPASQLYLAGPEVYLNVLRGVADQHSRVLVVGHNPGLEALVEALTGQSVILPTAALAQVALPLHSWRELEAGLAGELVSVWRPKALG